MCLGFVCARADVIFDDCYFPSSAKNTCSSTQSREDCMLYYYHSKINKTTYIVLQYTGIQCSFLHTNPVLKSAPPTHLQLPWQAPFFITDWFLENSQVSLSFTVFSMGNNVWVEEEFNKINRGRSTKDAALYKNNNYFQH